MSEKVMPGPVSGAGGIREAVCVHTKKIIDSCKDKDCIKDLRVYLSGCGQEALERASCVKAGKAELLYVSTDVEPVGFNRGFYTVDVRYYYRITADAFVGAARPVEITGLAVFDKRVILFGGEGSSKTFTSEAVFDGPDSPGLPRADQPVAVVEAVDPLVLGVDIIDPCDFNHHHCCCCDCQLSDVPHCIYNSLDCELSFDNDRRRLYVSLGQFSIIRLERDTQLLIPVYDYCIPEKECPGEQNPREEDPCELFRQIRFPVNEFFPADGPSYSGGCGCGCGIKCTLGCDGDSSGDGDSSCGRRSGCGNSCCN